jgi:hypothetical protein
VRAATKERRKDIEDSSFGGKANGAEQVIPEQREGQPGAPEIYKRETMRQGDSFGNEKSAEKGRGDLIGVQRTLDRDAQPRSGCSAFLL